MTDYTGTAGRKGVRALGQARLAQCTAKQNSRRRWQPADVSALKMWAPLQLATRVIARRLGRSTRAIYTKASRAGISLNDARAEVSL